MTIFDTDLDTISCQSCVLLLTETKVFCYQSASASDGNGSQRGPRDSRGGQGKAQENLLNRSVRRAGAIERSIRRDASPTTPPTGRNRQLSARTKAPSAGSNSSQGLGLGSIRRAFATRGASGDVAGSGARSHRRLGSFAAALVVALFCVGTLASSAGAAKAPIFDFGGAGTLGGQFNAPRGIAVNSSGNGGVPLGTVYVADLNNNRIQSFDSDGNFIRAWGYDVIQAGKPGDLGTGFEVCVVAADCKAGATGGAGGQFAAGSLAGIAVAQSTGNVAVIDRANRRIQQFSATGSFIRAWGLDVDSAGGSGFEICEVAANCKAGVEGTGAGAINTSGSIAGVGVDAAGNVYLADGAAPPAPTPASARVQKFSPTGTFLAMGGWNVDSVNPSTEYEVCTIAANCQAGTSGSGAGQFAPLAPSFLAVSPAGDVYAVDAINAKIVRLDSSLALVDAQFAPALVAGPALRAIAVNPADGHVFMAKQATDTNITEIDPATESLVVLHPAGATNWVGLAVNPLTGRIYAAINTGNFVRILDEGSFPKEVKALPATNNTGTRATLNGSVNPNGAELTQCFFEVAPAPTSGSTVPCAESLASIGSGTSPVAVHADISGLVPHGTKYNFRLVAANPGLIKSTNESFTTPVTVVTAAATAVTSSGATLNGTVNPDTVTLTDCVFEYGTTTAYGQTVPCDPNAAGIGSGTSPVPVEADLSGLNLATLYHFRLKATYGNGIGPVHGADRTLQTLGARILGTWSEEVVLSEAFLKGEIDPEGLATTYHFEYGTTEAYGQETPELPVGSDSTVHKVSRFLEGLEPGTTYHYRIVATNADAVNEGPDRTFTTFSRLVPDADCPNQIFRTGPSATLPDCRAYEMVSPIDKNGGDIETAEQEAGEGSHYSSAYRQASIHGGKITFSAATAFGDSLGGHWSNQYLATRGESGWSTHSISSRRGQTVAEPNLTVHRWYSYPFFQGFTPDLSLAWVRDDNVDPLTPDALQGYVNLYRRDNGADSYEALTNQAPVGPSGPFLTEDGNSDIGGPRIVGYSDDLRHQVFTASAALTPDADQSASEAGTKTQLYDLVDGELHLVSVLPNGQASADTSFAGTASGSRLVETRQQMLKNAVSDDGSRIVWSTGANVGPGTIYLRENPDAAEQTTSGACDEPGTGKACTMPVSGTVSPNPSQFWAAAADGSKVLFSFDVDPLLDVFDGHLYVFDVDTRTSTKIATGVQGVSAAAEDLSHIYFVSKEVLASGAISGQNNLYDYHDGTYSLIGPLSSVDLTGVGQQVGGSESGSGSITGGRLRPMPILNQTRVTPDGTRFAFMSNSAVLSEDSAGYDNTDVVTGKPDFQVYRYDAEAEELTCISCNPSGARPRGDLVHAPYSPLEITYTKHPDVRAAASIPTHEHDNYASRVLSDNGNRLFFHSYEAILPRDTNGVQDVYQWEAVGSGSCDDADADYFEQNRGCIHLISSGADGARSEFIDANANGEEVFFSTDAGLDPRDPGLRDIYVARIGGGFPLPQPLAACEGEACQSPPSPPNDPTPASSSFQGAGNVKEPAARKPGCPKGKRRVKASGGKVRCVKRKSAKRANRANNDRRASR